MIGFRGNLFTVCGFKKKDRKLAGQIQRVVNYQFKHYPELVNKFRHKLIDAILYGRDYDEALGYGVGIISREIKTAKKKK